MRITEFVDSQIAATATSTTYTTFKAPTWATRATLWFTTAITGTGTATIDFKLVETLPSFTTAPSVSETTTGTTGTFEVQTITMTGEPTGGAFRVGVTGQGTTTVYTTPYMPLAEVKNRPGRISDHLIEAGLPNASDLKWSVVAGTGATTPTVFTATFSGAFTGNQTAIAVTGDRLFTYAYQAGVDFADWNGVTQLTATGTLYDIVRISPGETGIADDDTAHVYKINTQIPEYFTAKVTVVAAVANNTASYSLFCTFSS
jgi:hypothetical protein